MDDTATETMDEFKYKTPEQETQNTPLFLPPGSIRALMAIAVVAAFVAICLHTKNIEALAVIATMIAKDYFESKKA